MRTCLPSSGRSSFLVIYHWRPDCWPYLRVRLSVGRAGLVTLALIVVTKRRRRIFAWRPWDALVRTRQRGDSAWRPWDALLRLVDAAKARNVRRVRLSFKSKVWLILSSRPLEGRFHTFGYVGAPSSVQRIREHCSSI